MADRCATPGCLTPAATTTVALRTIVARFPGGYLEDQDTEDVIVPVCHVHEVDPPLLLREVPCG